MVRALEGACKIHTPNKIVAGDILLQGTELVFGEALDRGEGVDVELLGEFWVILDEAVSHVVHIDRSFAMAEKKTRIVPIGIKPFELMAFA